FNFVPDSAPYKIFTEAGFVPAVSTNKGGTFHSFTGDTNGKRIDYIFLNDTWKLRGASILRPRKKSRSASDHDPIVATVEPKILTGTIGTQRSITTVWKPSQDSLVRSVIPAELLPEVEKIKNLITSRPDTEPD
ncbi:MAG: endonuclease/exonuclease/phosphatase family protein, partial [Phycisphaerales bacterium]